MSETSIGPRLQVTGEKEFKAAMASINDEFKLLGSEMKLAVSQFDKNDKSMEALTAQNKVLGKEIDSQKSRIALLTTQYDKQNGTLATLKDKLDATKAAFGADSAEVAKAQKEYDKQNRAVMALQTQLNNATTGLNDMERALESNNQAIAENSEGLGEFGEKMKEMGKAVAIGMAAVGAAFLGAIVAGVTMSDDLTKALNGLQASAGIADEQMSGMEDTMLSIYNNNFGEDFGDIGKALGEVKKQTGAAGEELEDMAESALAMRDTFEFEVTESVRTVDMMMKQFGVTSDEAFNLIAQGAQAGLDKNGNLLDSINEYSIHFEQLGFDSEEMFNMMANGAKSGVFDIDKLGDAMKEFGIRSKDGSKTSAEGFAALKLDAAEMTKAFAAGGDTSKAAFEKTTTALMAMKDPVAQNAAGVALFGTQWEDVGVKGIAALVNTRGEISLTEDALRKINEVKYNDFGSAVEGIKRQLLTGIVLPLGQEVLPKLNEFSNELKQNIPAIIEDVKPVINGLVDSFKFLADNIGIIVPILSSVVAGFTAFKVIAGIASAVSLFSGVMAVATTGAVAATPVVGLLAGAFTLLTGPVGLGVAAVALFAGGATLISNKLKQEVIPATDLFGTSVSDSTKAAVTAYMEMDNKVGASLLSFKASNATITTAFATEMVGTFEKMGTDIKAGRDKHYEEDLANLTKFYADQGLLDMQEAQTTLAKMKQDHIDKESQVDTFEVKIKTIYEKAASDHRSITQEEENEVRKIKDEMQKLAIEALTNSEKEQADILTRMRLQAGDISTKQAGEVIANSAKQRDETTKLANDQYEKTVASITRQRNEGVIKSDDQAKEMIDAAERIRVASITKAEDVHEKVVYELQKQNEDVGKKINSQDGSIKTGWDNLKTWFDNTPIVRWIKTKTSGGTSSGSDVDDNYSGTNNFRGGLTTLHEKGYEVYDLPRGSKIYNHEASEDLVLKTAQEVAKGVLANNQGNGGLSLSIEKFINNRAQDVQAFAEELEFYRKQTNVARGGS